MTTDAAQGRAQLELALDSRLPELIAEVRDLLADGWPEYAAFLDQNPDGMQQAAELFVHRLLDMAEHGRSASGSTGSKARRRSRSCSSRSAAASGRPARI